MFFWCFWCRVRFLIYSNRDFFKCFWYVLLSFGLFKLRIKVIMFGEYEVRIVDCRWG